MAPEPVELHRTLASIATPAGWARFLNLADAGEPFLKHENLELRQDGSAIFSGELSAASGTFAGDLSAAGGTFAGDLTAATTRAESFEVVADIEGDVSENVEVRLGADSFEFFDNTNSRTSLRIYPELNNRATIGPHEDLLLAPLTAAGRIRMNIGNSGGVGIVPVAGVHISSSSPGSTLGEGILWIQT